MEILNASVLLAALGHESRLAIFRLLVQAGKKGLYAGFIGDALQMAPATLSFHLAHLQRTGLIHGERESRHIRYVADYEAMNELLHFLTNNCCEGEPCLSVKTNIQPEQFSIPLNSTAVKKKASDIMEPHVYQVLFLCTGNSARSILAEALLNHLGKGRFLAFSAGSHPTGTVNPFALELLQQQNLPVENLRSKSWDEFSQAGAPTMDFVFTVCDKAAGEKCPVWPGQPMTAHWGIDDPVITDGSDEQKKQAMRQAFHLLQRRIGLLLNLPTDKLDRLSLQQEFTAIGMLPRHETLEPT